jgi:ubiquitin-conjugating enzyme E2 Z
VGPFDTPYEGGFFYFRVNFLDDYPQTAPKVKLITTGGGSVRFNPNLYANGKVCLSILGTWHGPSWSPVNTLSSVLLSIQSLMNEKPLRNEPGFETADVIQCNNYSDGIRHDTLRVAVCEMASAGSSMNAGLPEALRSVVNALFPNFYDSYELTCQSNMHKDGSQIVDPQGDDRGKFNYAGIQAKLKEIYEVILENMDDEEGGEEGGAAGQKCESTG